MSRVFIALIILAGLPTAYAGDSFQTLNQQNQQALFDDAADITLNYVGALGTTGDCFSQQLSALASGELTGEAQLSVSEDATLSVPRDGFNLALGAKGFTTALQEAGTGGFVLIYRLASAPIQTLKPLSRPLQAAQCLVAGAA